MRGQEAGARPRGRWAPSPSGLLHVGNARTALAAWLSVRSRRGTFLWRLEDLDPPRTVPGAAAAAEEDLAWLGLDWDEGPRPGGPFAPYEQSRRSEIYEAALARLAAVGRLFPCNLSRKDLEEISTAPHGRPYSDTAQGGGEGSSPYPASLRPKNLPPDWYERHLEERVTLRKGQAGAALRFVVHPSPVTFTDRVAGTLTERVDHTVGDFVLRRRDSLYAYQLAVVVDDLAMEIDEVVRGRDLIDSTARQIQLIEALGGTPPAYAHVPLLLDADGEKLSKRHASLTLASLREAGVRPERLAGYLAASLGLIPEERPVTPAELVGIFDWERVRKDDSRLPKDLPRRLLS